MHFSRNPPGPNTSCIEGFADSAVDASAAPSGGLPPTLGSSSGATVPRWVVLAALLTLASAESPVELDARFARNPPLLSPIESGRPATIAHPVAPPAAPQRALGHCISLDSVHLAVEHPGCFCVPFPLSRRVTFGSGGCERSPFQEGQTQTNLSWGAT